MPEQATATQDYELWEEHADAVLMFMRCQTQWRTGPAGVIGLDYGVVLQMMALYDVQDRPRVMEDLQVIEGRVRELLNKAMAPQEGY